VRLTIFQQFANLECSCSVEVVAQDLTYGSWLLSNFEALSLFIRTPA
jgi:hypothetical protein